MIRPKLKCPRKTQRLDTIGIAGYNLAALIENDFQLGETG
jgi:hypothetical protein